MSDQLRIVSLIEKLNIVTHSSVYETLIRFHEIAIPSLLNDSKLNSCESRNNVKWKSHTSHEMKPNQKFETA